MIHWPINIGKRWGGLVVEPYKGAKGDGWRGFGKGLGKGIGNWILPPRGLAIAGKQYGIRAAYNAIKKRMGSGTLSFILAAHFAQGFEEVRASTEEERMDVLRRWHRMAPDLTREHSGASKVSSAGSSLTASTTSSSVSSKAGKANQGVQQ